MATLLRAQVTINRLSLLPEDASVNVWHFWTDLADPVAGATEASATLEGFYAAIDAYLASSLQATANVKWYDLTDPQPRVPIFTDSYSLVLGAGSFYPGEVAVCMSYSADLVAGTNPARRRGRIFLGPIDLDVGTASTSDMRVSAAARTGITAGASALATAGLGIDSYWATFSPTSAGAQPWDSGVLAASSERVLHGFVDDAFDTVRSRGLKPSTRTSWSVALP